MNPKDQLKEHISILDVAALYVNLKAAGKNYKALCPFHSEKTPSFFIFPDKNTFSCFGCNKFGDIITLVEEMEHITFVEAIHFLADKFHVPIEKSKKDPIEKNAYFAINEIAYLFFQDNLQNGTDGEIARDYLLKRGITKQTIEQFAIGYAPQKWDTLYTHLQKKGADINKAIELGLLVKNENNRIYDRFRGRVMFPIFSDASTLLAFGGRTLFEDPAKYINSPDSQIYHKGEHLFGLQLAKDAIRKNKAAIFVEGYMDQISMFQAGITHTIAVLGTGLTEKQIYKIKRFAEDIFLFYDSDTAGINAALRGIEKMFEQNINPKILLSKENKDPDELIRKSGSSAIKELIDHAQSGFHFLLNSAVSTFDWQKPEKKKQALDWVMSSVAKFSDDITRDEYRKQVAEFFRIDPSKIKFAAAKTSSQAEASAPLKLSLDERDFLQAILKAPHIIPRIREFFSGDMLAVLQSKNILRIIFEHFDTTGDIHLNSLTTHFSTAENTLLHDIYLSLSAKKTDKKDISMLEKKAAACVINFRKKMEKKIITEINREIIVAEREKNVERIHFLMQKKFDYMKLTKHIREDVIE